MSLAAAAWHIIRTQYGQERATVGRLREVLPGAFTPMRQDRERGLIALWSGYAFGRWETADPYAWHRAHDTAGVSKILHANGSELPVRVLPRDLVDGWIALADADGVVPGLEPPAAINGFAGLAGRTVRLMDGMTGKVLRIDDRGWAVIRTTLFNRPHDIAMPAEGLVTVDESGRAPRRHGYLRMKKNHSKRRWVAGLGLVAE